MIFRLPVLTMAAAGLFFAPLSGGITPAEAKVVVNQEIKFFRVRGKTPQALFKDFQKKSPIKAKGKFDAALGVASIRFDPKVKYATKGSRCKVVDVVLTLNIEIFLPRWSNYKQADKLGKLSWDRLFADVKEHELHHAAIAKGYAERVERKIKSYRSRRSCEALEKTISAASIRLLNRHDRAQRKYDLKETRRISQLHRFR